MNDLLQLKGTFEQKKGNPSGGKPNLPKNQSIESLHLKKLLQELETLYQGWKKERKYFTGVLVQVLYSDVVAKSRRLSSIFSVGKRPANETIVGVKFSDTEEAKHIITHYISIDLLEQAIERYRTSIVILDNDYGGCLSYAGIENINNNKELFPDAGISKTLFTKILVDSYYIESFFLESIDVEFTESAIISIYDTNTDTIELMKKIGITLFPTRILDKITLYLDPEQIQILKSRAPYLIAMAVNDISLLTKTDFECLDENCKISIPKPTNEPTIGVIDTLFDENVYFSEWVEFKNMLDPNFEITAEDYEHGTAVSSIIVDGVAFNPDLEDGCGRFKVRHFGVALSKHFSSFSILKSIEKIVLENRDIKVWNLSLGSVKEIHPHYISPEGAFLDKLQHEKDIIFVIAGTNKANNEEEKFIGSPADSINSLVVNSVDQDNKKASYSRRGPVLSFFTKPDIAYFGGDKSNKIKVCTPTGEALLSGTSFAAPWIARKLSYLIDILGLSREVAKALIIHSALSWKGEVEDPSYIGYGIVPRHIDDIVKSGNDEIRFVISGTSEEHLTYTYNLPVPEYNDEHPFLAKATMCYFPVCSRKQGVDYTNTEFEFTFGRINEKDRIQSIAKNAKKTPFLYEQNARTMYRKWDNVKNLLEIDSGKNKPRKAYSKKMWGINIRTLERLNHQDGRGLNFGLVITLKEMNGKNCIEDFIQQCQLRGWLVNRINVQNRIAIHNKAEEEVHFEDL